MSVDPQDYYYDDLNSPADTREEREGDNYRVYVFRPIWEPFNESARELTHSYIESLSLPTTSGKPPKYEAVVASLLQAIRHVLWKRSSSTYEAGKPWFVGASLANDKLANFPLAGRDVISRTVKAFQENELLTLVEGSGLREFSETASGKTAYKGIMTMWEPNAKMAGDYGFHSAKFIETGRPRLLINRAETKTEQKRRKRHNDLRQRIKTSDCRTTFGPRFAAVESRIVSLCNYWRQHPLEFPDGSAAACAVRVFSDGRMDVGGRLYGRWTNLPKVDRFKLTIDGQPILSLDIAASQPTLLSALLGVPLQNLSEEKRWYDVYLQLPRDLLWHEKDKKSEAPTSLEIFEENVRRNRSIAKGVVMELIGTGNCNKAHPSSKLREDLALDDEEWLLFRDRLTEAIPALCLLEPRYDSSGNLSGYINGPAFLTYHESEIMILTLERLRDHCDVPAYPVHDCLLVKEKDREVAARVFAQSISDYCAEVSGQSVWVALTTELKDGSKRTSPGQFT